MSSVRMCDRCGNIFSERQEGWGTFTGTSFRKDETGRRYQESVQLDACPVCNTISDPQQEISPKLDDTSFFENAELKSKLKELEKENRSLKRNSKST